MKGITMDLSFSGYVGGLGYYRRLNGIEANSDVELSIFKVTPSTTYTPPKDAIIYVGGFYDSSFFNKTVIDRLSGSEIVEFLNYIELCDREVKNYISKI
jgi:hypothetical protein